MLTISFNGKQIQLNLYVVAAIFAAYLILKYGLFFHLWSFLFAAYLVFGHASHDAIRRYRKNQFNLESKPTVTEYIFIYALWPIWLSIGCGIDEKFRDQMKNDLNPLINNKYYQLHKPITFNRPPE